MKIYNRILNKKMGTYSKQFVDRFQECDDVFTNINKCKTLIEFKKLCNEFKRYYIKQISYRKENKELKLESQIRLIKICEVLNVISMKKIKNLNELEKFYIDEMKLIKNEMKKCWCELNGIEDSKNFEMFIKEYIFMIESLEIANKQQYKKFVEKLIEEDDEREIQEYLILHPNLKRENVEMRYKCQIK